MTDALAYCCTRINDCYKKFYDTIGCMWLVVRSKCCYKKTRCAFAIVAVISLLAYFCPSYRFTFPLYVYVNLLTFGLTLLPLSHTLCLSPFSLCVSLLDSSLSPPLCFAYKPMANLFVLSLIAINSSDKHGCFTQRAEHNDTDPSTAKSDSIGCMCRRAFRWIRICKKVVIIYNLLISR